MTTFFCIFFIWCIFENMFFGVLHQKRIFKFAVFSVCIEDIPLLFWDFMFHFTHRFIIFGNIDNFLILVYYHSQKRWCASRVVQISSWTNFLCRVNIPKNLKIFLVFCHCNFKKPICTINRTDYLCRHCITINWLPPI